MTWSSDSAVVRGRDSSGCTPGRDNDTPERREALLAQIPTRLLGEPEHLAQTVVFLAAPESVNITGVILPLDGGHSI